MTNPIWLPVAVALAATGCGSGSESTGEAPAAARAPSDAAGARTNDLRDRRYTSADPVTIDGGAADALPGDTAGAFTIADLPALAGKIGLGIDSGQLLRALRRQLETHLGFDLFDPDQAAGAGVDTGGPVTLAWLDPDGDELVLIVTVTDADKLEQTLGERPRLVRGNRALIPLGRRGSEVQKRLAAVDGASSLAGANRLTGFAATRFGADAALYVDLARYGGMGDAANLTAGLTVRDDGIRAAAAISFSAAPPEPLTFANLAARRLGASLSGEPPYAHQLLRELERETTDPVATFAVEPAVYRLLGVEGKMTLGKPLGWASFAGRTDDRLLVFYGGVAFDGALAPEIARSAVDMVPYPRPTFGSGALGQADLAGDLMGTFGDDDPYGGIGLADLDSGGGIGLGWGTIDDSDGTIGTMGGGGTIGGGVGVGSGGLGRRGPRVSVRSLTVSGGLDRTIVRRYLRRSTSALTACYQIADDPALEGTATVRFRIDDDGQPGKVRVTGFDRTVSDCAARTIGELRFPRPKSGPAEVTAKLRFRPGAK